MDELKNPLYASGQPPLRTPNFRSFACSRLLLFCVLFTSHADYTG